MSYYSHPVRQQGSYRSYRAKTRKKQFIGRGILVVIFVCLVFLGANKVCTPPEDATAKYKKNLENDPTSVDAYLALGKSFSSKAIGSEYSEEKEEFFQEAIGFFRKAIILDKDKKLIAETHYQLGLTYFKMSRLNPEKTYYREAEEEFKTAINEGLKQSDVHLYLGHLYFKKNALDAAMEEYKIARELNPNDISAWYNLGWTYKIKGLYHESINAFQEVLSVRGLDDKFKVKIYLILGEIYSSKNELSFAHDEYKKILKLDRNSVDAHYWLGCIYKKQGNLKDAKKEWRRVLRLSPNHVEARNELTRLSKS